MSEKRPAWLRSVGSVMPPLLVPELVPDPDDVPLLVPELVPEPDDVPLLVPLVDPLDPPSMLLPLVVLLLELHAPKAATTTAPTTHQARVMPASLSRYFQYHTPPVATSPGAP
jgi:hypothetical protein